MAIKSVRAALECDGCGRKFTVDLDPADEDLKSYLDLAAYVEDHVDAVGEHHLCPSCAVKVAQELEDVEDPTYDQVHNVFTSTALV